MKQTIQIALGLSAAILFLGCSRAHSGNVDTAKIRAKLDSIPLDQQVNLTNEEWQAILSPEQFHVMRQAGTEQACAAGNKLEYTSGIYVCSACGNPLYRAENKFNSGTGWPSFYQPIHPGAVQQKSGSEIFGSEILCGRCGSHLGHVFNDGPAPTGLRYCMNSVALKHRADK